ncbi:RipA family octameric membrane protein [Chitinimonas koreensis]|uniref:RipA family octameric membrane protein n=1 Tax=Chitinimonas koreensis TaxID=356302 RepID=UPI0012F8D9CC|nr:hypothetical protein [Chitinimonas koreensis]QNM98196.1 hypothetical protein H9L41_08120 [Chitinimonas koreensis]
MAELEKDENQQPGNSIAVGVGVVVNNSSDQNEEHPDVSALKALFKTTLETRNFEISMLVQRNNFFMIFQGVLFAGLIQSSHQKPIVSFMVCLAGFLVSFFQIKMAAGAKFWQEYWEQALHKIEGELLRSMDARKSGRRYKFQLFHDEIHIYEKMVRDRLKCNGDGFINRLIMSRYSVSRVPIYVAIVLAAIWFTLVLCTLRAYPPLAIPSFIVGF